MGAETARQEQRRRLGCEEVRTSELVWLFCRLTLTFCRNLYTDPLEENRQATQGGSADATA